ncbi:MAG: glycosyltransferase [Phycisphaerales bacterium]|nr:MAG: glycosyltransferase [Phycisphaerales bacterium]
MIPVAMAISRAHPSLERAVACALNQEGVETELLLVVNGTDAQAIRAAERLDANNARIRVLFRESPGLSGALNLALRSTDAEFVARMDDDDLCEPHRLHTQLRRMRERPDLAAVGCAWRVLGPNSKPDSKPDSKPIAIVRPPTEPNPLHARLLQGNCLAHGSMLLRRRSVLDAGGYDETLDKAQDLDLWLRLSTTGRIGAVPDILYTHCLREENAALSTSREQAHAAATVLARAWAALPRGDDEADHAELIDAVAEVLERTDDPASRDGIDRLIRERGPTLGAMVAALWASARVPPMTARAVEICRRSRLREVGAELRNAGAASVTLWGAGSHAEWILDHAGDLGLPINGLIDDQATGELRGLAITRPEAAEPGAFVLIASDSFEDQIWERSLPHRTRGVRVYRLYGA